MNCEKAYASLLLETKTYFEKAGYSKAVVGLSGGIDSSLTAFLLTDALGKENVTGLLMPDSQANNPQDRLDALETAKQLGINFGEIPIGKTAKVVETSLKWKQNALAKMNLKARIRMVFLYDYANSLKALVVGTGNKSELTLGYFTKYGDGAADFFPLKSLFKTQVFELAKFKKLPETIIKKKPSAGLFRGQTDEADLGAGYKEIDLFLQEKENGKKEKELREKFGEKLANSLLKRIKENRHKRL